MYEHHRVTRRIRSRQNIIFSIIFQRSVKFPKVVERVDATQIRKEEITLPRKPNNRRNLNVPPLSQEVPVAAENIRPSNFLCIFFFLVECPFRIPGFSITAEYTEDKPPGVIILLLLCVTVTGHVSARYGRRLLFERIPYRTPPARQLSPECFRFRRRVQNSIVERSRA